MTWGRFATSCLLYGPALLVRFEYWVLGLVRTTI